MTHGQLIGIWDCHNIPVGQASGKTVSVYWGDGDFKVSYMEVYYDLDCNQHQLAQTFTKVREGKIVDCFDDTGNRKNSTEWKTFRLKNDLVDGMETSLKAHGKPAA